MYLELTGVRKMYDEDNGVKQIDLAVEKGMLLTLLGPSGCGKTTLLNLLGGFLKPDAGSIFLDGQEITSCVPEERPVSTVFQSYALFPHMNVLENVCYGLRFFHRMKKRDAVPVAEKYLDIVGLSEYEKAPVTALSGGQQQRVALARAMATEPKVLLLDEPLSNLDASLRLRMRGELKRLQRKTGMTMIFVTHDQEEALSLSDRIAVMKDGRIEQIGTPDEIYNHPKTSYVATFVGNANILHGAAERIQGENAIVKIGNDRVIVKLETSQQNTEDTGVKQYLSAGEKVTLAVRSENILLQETAVIGDTGTDYRDAVDISVADGSLDAHNKNSVSGLQATVTEKNFAGGQLRVTLKLSDGTQLIASRYGIDASVAEGQTVRCSFLPTDAVLVDREDIHEEA